MSRFYRANSPSYYPASDAPEHPEAVENARARAPLAIAASVAVMALGTGFLIMTATTTPADIGKTPASGQRVVINLDKTADPVAAVSPPVADTDLPAATPFVTTAPAETRDLPAPQPKSSNAAPATIFTNGVAPRLNPRRNINAPDATNQGGRSASDGGLTPRLKPRGASITSAEPAAQIVSRPITLGGAWLADERDQPPPVFFASDLAPRRAKAPALAINFDQDYEEYPSEIRVRLSKGETFVDALRRAGVRAQDRNAAAYAFGKHQNLRTLRPGQEFVLTTVKPNQTLFQLATMDEEPEAHLLSLDFRADSESRVSVRRNHSGGFEAEKAAVTITSRLATVEGRIDGSLYLSAKRAGAPDEVIAGLADMFAYDIDFQREIFGGDEFEAIFEMRYDENGNAVGGGDILYGRLKWRGRSKEKGYYRFASTDGGKKADYFDRAGQSAKRLLMKTPIDGARLSSGFGTRRHPILGYAKAHKGVDFAAQRGTPIKAAGDGVVERANRYGSFGNYIRIRHANGYKTAYAHLKGFRKGVRAGKRVRQGDTIGYVGTTGRSTGPHLHYEVHLNGKAVNPQRLRIATGVQLKSASLDRFKTVRDKIDAIRIPHTDENTRLLAKEDTTTDSL